MNPKKEFVNALMSVLRLDQNIYTVGAIEEVIDRVDIKDYTMFVAYIGERESNFEKPIQSIAKAVDEFHRKKIIPTSLALFKEYQNLSGGATKVILGLTKEKMTEDEDIKMRERYKAKKDRGDDSTITMPHKDVYMKWVEEQRDIIHNSKDKDLSDYKQVFIKYKAEELFEFATKRNLSVFNIFTKRISQDSFFDSLYKPSIIQKIDTTAINEASTTTKIKHNEVKELVHTLELQMEWG